MAHLAAVLGLLALLLTVGVVAQLPVLKIGGSLSKCGDGVEGSESFRTALLFWENYTNSHGGIIVNNTQYQVQLILYNDAFDPDLITLLYKRLILVDQVDALLSPFTIAIPAFIIAQQYGVRPCRFIASLTQQVPIINMGDFTYYSVKGAPNGTFGGWVFSAVPNSLSFIDACFQVLRDQGLHTGISAWPSNIGNAGFNILNLLSAPKFGLALVPPTEYRIERDLSNVDQVVSSMKKLHTDFFSGGMLLTEDNLVLLHEIRKQAWNPKAILFWLGTPFETFRSAAGWEAYRIFGSNFWDPSLNYTDPQFGSSQGFYDEFKAAHGVAPEPTSALAVFAAVTLKLAFEKAGTLDKVTVRDALSLLNEETFFGFANYSAPFNQTSNQYYCFQVNDDGNLIPVSENAIAKQQLLWPASVPAPAGFYPPEKSHVGKWIGLGVGLGVGLLFLAALVALLYWLVVKYQVIFIPNVSDAKDGEW